jgi:FtsP/CotA-like multicopper oxidase with cupredoxin domain
MARPLILAVFGGFLSSQALAAAPDACAALDKLYPQPGRAGIDANNAFRPLPLFTPVRATPGAAATLSLSILVDHVSTAPAGAPGYVYVGNYPVTDIPVFRLLRGAATKADMVNAEDGRTTPIADQCLDSPDFGFGGSQWALVQGDTLDVAFASRLDYTGRDSIERPTNGAVPCRSSNLHTHGLLISPYHPVRAGTGPYGDYIYDVTMPVGSDVYGAETDNCGTLLGDIPHMGHGITSKTLHYVDLIPGTPGVSSLESGQHPSGLFWYHPHPHGYAQPEVSGGTTGAITIGNLTDYACPAGDGTPGACSISNANIRVMALKDTEITPANTGAGMWTTVHSSDSGYCPTTGGSRHGECYAPATSTAPAGKWVFSINGVQYPTLKAAAGRTEIWRIINSSANFTYQLSVAPEAAGGANLPFQVLSTDGVSVRPKLGAAMRTVLLVMPATRVEIAIPAPAAGGAYILRNESVETGQSGVGDIWPEIDLARVVWDPPAAGAQVAAAGVSPVIVRGPATPIPRAPVDQASLPPACRFAAGDTRLIYFVHRFVQVFGASSPPGKSGVQPNENEVFGLLAGIRHADGTIDFYGDSTKKVLHTVEAAWQAGINSGDTDFPAFGHNNYGDICTVQGNVEPWELINWTGEDHNFHVHQSRFTLNPDGFFQFPEAAQEPKEDAGIRQTDKVLHDFFDPAYETTYHDTIPVPRGQSICRTNPAAPGCHGVAANECSGTPGDKVCARPGIISVIMDFSRAEQVGKFVYHCHILEHEDGGMMAQITVMCPPGDSTCAAQQAAANICIPKTE